MEKKNTGLIVLVVVLVIALLGTSAFIVYDKVLSNNTKVENENTEENKNTNKVENQEKTENFDLNNSLVQNLYSMINLPVLKDMNGYYYFYKNVKITIDNIDNDVKLYMAYSQLSDSDIIETKTPESGGGYFMSASFDIDKFDSAMKKTFGNNVTYIKDDFMPEGCDSYNFHYDDNSKQYKSDPLGGCGGGPSLRYLFSEPYKAIKQNDNIILYEKFAFINIGDFNDEGDIDLDITIYKDVEFKNIIKKLTKNVDYSEDAQIISNLELSEEFKNEISLDSYFDQMSMVKYTFKKGDNNSYHFYSSEIVENF